MGQLHEPAKNIDASDPNFRSGAERPMKPYFAEQLAGDDFELPAPQCDRDSHEPCESCQ